MKVQNGYPRLAESIQMATSAVIARNTRAVASQRSVRRTSPELTGARARHRNLFSNGFKNIVLHVNPSPESRKYHL